MKGNINQGGHQDKPIFEAAENNIPAPPPVVRGIKDLLDEIAELKAENILLKQQLEWSKKKGEAPF